MKLLGSDVCWRGAVLYDVMLKLTEDRKRGNVSPASDSQRWDITVKNEPYLELSALPIRTVYNSSRSV